MTLRKVPDASQHDGQDRYHPARCRAGLTGSPTSASPLWMAARHRDPDTQHRGTCGTPSRHASPAAPPTAGPGTGTPRTGDWSAPNPPAGRALMTGVSRAHARCSRDPGCDLTWCSPAVSVAPVEPFEIDQFDVLPARRCAPSVRGEPGAGEHQQPWGRRHPGVRQEIPQEIQTGDLRHVNWSPCRRDLTDRHHPTPRASRGLHHHNVDVVALAVFPAGNGRGKYVMSRPTQSGGTGVTQAPFPGEILQMRTVYLRGDGVSIRSPDQRCASTHE